MKRTVLSKVFFVILLAFLSLGTSAVSRKSCLNAILACSAIDCESADTTRLQAFSDTADLDERTAKTISAALEKGIINGYGDGTLRTEQEVTRAEIACMIYRARDYFPPFSEKLCESGVYSDLSDWNVDAVRYCLENGYMVGYGDAFGSNDLVTGDQLDIIVRRLRFGCNTREKYFVRQLCGTSPIDLNAIYLSAYDEELKAPVFSAFPEHAVLLSEPAEAIKERLETLLEKLGNLDYRKLADAAYRAQVEADFGSLYGSRSAMGIQSSDFEHSLTIHDITEQALVEQTVRESICVISPTSCQSVSIVPGFTVTRAYGYEYFCEESPQNGSNVQKWYRRTVKAEINRSATNVLLSCVFGQPEEIEQERNV